MHESVEKCEMEECKKIRKFCWESQPNGESNNEGHGGNHIQKKFQVTYSFHL